MQNSKEATKWEQIYNPDFKVVEFDHFKNEAGYMPKKSRIDARPPRLSLRPACHALKGGKTKSCEIEALRAGGGQAPGVLHHIIARGSVQSTCLRLPVRLPVRCTQTGIRTQTGASHRQVGKSLIRGEKKATAKKYSLTGKVMVSKLEL